MTRLPQTNLQNLPHTTYTIMGTNLPHLILQPMTTNAGYETDEISTRGKSPGGGERTELPGRLGAAMVWACRGRRRSPLQACRAVSWRL